MAGYRRILYEGRGCYECPPPPSPPLTPPASPSPLFHDEHPGRRLTNSLLIAAAIFAASILLSLTYYAVLRRRRRPLGGAPAGPASAADDDAASLDEGEPFHHVWYIPTVGLDESTIGSIAVAEYRAGDGLLDGVSDCSVCLGEFRDGERVRLLPKCCHAFHVACIDTWLRAHVNCPLCRAHIVNPNAEPAAALPITAASASVDLDDSSSTPLETPQIRIQPLQEEEEQTGGGGPEIGTPISPSQVLDKPPESCVSRVPIDLVGYGLQPVRRPVSMDTPSMNAIIGIIDEGKDPNFEEEIAPKNRGKEGSSDIGRSLSSSGRGFFFSRHGRVARIHSMPM